MEVSVLYRNGRTRVFDNVLSFWLGKYCYHVVQDGHVECVNAWRVLSFTVK